MRLIGSAGGGQRGGDPAAATSAERPPGAPPAAAAGSSGAAAEAAAARYAALTHGSPGRFTTLSEGLSAEGQGGGAPATPRTVTEECYGRLMDIATCAPDPNPVLQNLQKLHNTCPGS